jgi:hypothetical protein
MRPRFDAGALALNRTERKDGNQRRDGKEALGLRGWAAALRYVAAIGERNLRTRRQGVGKAVLDLDGAARRGRVVTS